MTLGELPVGTLVIDQKTKYYNAPIVWRVLEHDHEDDPENSTTLISDKILTLKCFDAEETGTGQNYRYLYSNILQWLNSDADAGQWYTPQHSGDKPPTTAYVYDGENPYDQEAGFLHDFSQTIKSSMLLCSKKTGLYSSYGKNYEEVERKVQLLSRTEIGDSYDYVEGTAYSAINSKAKRISSLSKECAENTQTKNVEANKPWGYLLRTGYLNWGVYYIRNDGEIGSGISTYYGNYGVQPLIWLSKNEEVYEDLTQKGTYILFEEPIPPEPDFPENPMDGIWRTPKTDWTETDAFNLTDYKRIRNNLLFLRNKISDIWGEFNVVDMGNDPSDPRYIWKVQYFNAIEENLETINQHSLIVKNYGYKQKFYQNGVFIGFSELNRIESATLQMKRIIEGWEAGLRKLSFRLGAPKGLYL